MEGRDFGAIVPAGLDDFGGRGVQVQLGDEAVSQAEESLRLLLGLQLQLVDGVNVSDGVHCRQKTNTNTQK